MRMAVIDDGNVINIIEADEDFTLPGKVLVSAGNAGIGWTYDGVSFSPPTPQPPPVPEDISDLQFAQALAIKGLISQADALAWVKVGTVPAQLQAIVDAIPDDATRFAANMLLGGATVFQRHHAMVPMLATGMEITDEQIDDIWRLGATL